jgi:hypothetical protein
LARAHSAASADRSPIAIHPLHELAQERQIAHPARLLGNPARLGQPRFEPRIDNGIAARHQPRLEPGFFLQRHLPETLAVIQPRIEQHVAHDGEHFLDFVGHGLAREEKPSRAAIPPLPRGEAPMLCNTARRTPDTLRQRNEILLARPRLQQRPPEQRHIGQQLLVEHMEIKPEIEIDDPQRRQVMIE